MHRLLTICLLASAVTNSTPYTQNRAPWHDPSPHKVQVVMVEEGVRLEVLDWGGSGRNVLLLAGSGNTAHVFDDFAPKLAESSHVYGITRRGFGASSHPDSGYDQQRLADDVLQVLDTLKIVAPVLAGHSMSGEELTTLGDEHSDRLAARSTSMRRLTLQTTRGTARPIWRSLTNCLQPCVPTGLSRTPRTYDRFKPFMTSKCGRTALNTQRPNCAPVSTRIPTVQWVVTILPTESTMRS